MERKRSIFVVTSAMALLIGVFASEGVANARTDIGPGEHFVGLVNKHTANAIILMACGPPLSPNETGHPLGGQTIAVEPPPTTAGSTGFTGTRGRSITAGFVLAKPEPATNGPVTFSHYGSEAIPTSLVLPCSGSGLAVFSPQPTSKTAQDAEVSVTFANITVGPPQSAVTP